MKKTITTLLFVLALMLVLTAGLTACGGNTESDTSGGNTEPDTSGTGKSAVTVIELMSFSQNVSQTVHLGDKFSAVGAFDYEWEAAVLEEHSGFELSSRYAFLNITALDTEKESDGCSWYEYIDESNELYYYYSVFDGGFEYFEVSDSGDSWADGCTVTYQIFGQVSAITYTEHSGTNEYYVVDNNGSRVAYKLVDYTVLGAGFTVEEVNCYNGALLLLRGDEVLKDEYIQVVFNGAGIKSSIYVRANEEFTLPKGSDESAEYTYTIAGEPFTDNKISQAMFDAIKADGRFSITIQVSVAD